MKKRFQTRGFTIVELVIVIAVIAILAAVLIPTFGSIVDKAKDSKAIQEAKNAYTQHMIDNAADAEMARYYVFKADKKRFVAILDGAPQGVFSSRDEAVRSLLDDPETYIYKTTVKNLFAVNKGTVVVDNDGNNTSTFDEIKLITGDHYLGGSTTDTTVASSEVKVYLRGGEGLTLLDRENYEVDLVASINGSESMSVVGTTLLFISAPTDGWYGVMIRKSDGSAFDFENGDSDLLSHYVKITFSMRTPIGSSGVSNYIHSSGALYLHKGEIIKLKDEYMNGYTCKAKYCEDIRGSWNVGSYDLEVAPEGLVITEDGWYAFAIKRTIENPFFIERDDMNLYCYVTISGADD